MLLPNGLRRTVVCRNVGRDITRLQRDIITGSDGMLKHVAKPPALECWHPAVSENRRVRQIILTDRKPGVHVRRDGIVRLASSRFRINGRIRLHIRRKT